MATSKRRNYRPQKSSGPGAETVAALKSLRESGPESFEDLVASLLAALSEVPFRLCRSGLQPGVDALSDGSVGVEVKLYDSKLPIRDLRGALSHAADPSLGLDLWVAVSTVSVGGAGYRELVELGLRLGVAVLILDADSAQSVGAPPVAALCATNPDKVLYALENWRDPKKVKEIDLPAVRKDLLAVRALPGFDKFLAKLRKDLSEPIWPLLVRRQNRKLANQIREDPSTFFRVPYEQSRSVRRKVEDDIESWLNRVVGPASGLAAVVGERFDGKTWCVLDWLLGRLETLPNPVFFVSSLQGDGGLSLEAIILEQIRQALGSFGRHAPEFLRRVRQQSPERGPWALIVLDGLDEYRLQEPDRHLHWALESRKAARSEVAVMGQLSPTEDSFIEGVEEEIRPCTVLCTCRRPSWRGLENRIETTAQGRVTVLQIGPYDNEELASALAIEKQPPDLFAGFSEAVQALVRRPRYLRLLIDNPSRLDHYQEVTEDLLYWFDAQDEIRRSRPGVRDWSETAYQDVLRDLARRYIDEGRLRHGDVRSALGQATENVSAALQDLESEGVLETMPDGKYRVRPEQLRVGMGLHLLDLLEQAKRQNRDLVIKLRDAMEPILDSDPKVEWLRWATIVSLYRDNVHPNVIDTLVAAWLSSRNLPGGDIQQVQRLSPRLLASLLRLAPNSWSSAERNERMREISRLVITEHLEEKKDLIGKHVRSWMRLVPTQGPYFIEDKPDAEESIRSALSDPSLGSLDLRRCGDSGILLLQGFGLHLEDLSPGLIGPEDLLALMAVRHIPMYHFNSFVDSEDLLFRRQLAETPFSWFEEKVREASADPGMLYARTIHHFLLAADRVDLLPLAESIAPAEKPARQRKSPRTDSLAFWREHKNVVLDPSSPQPFGPEVAIARSAWTERFAVARLEDDPNLQTTSEDLDYERTLPAIAAWAPELGAELIRQHMYELPAKLAAGRHLWARSIERHAVLAEGDTRAPLVEVTQRKSEDQGINLAVGHVLVSLLPAMSSPEVLDAVLDHHIDFEWKDLFEVASSLKAESLQELLLKRIEAQHNSKHLARLYFLLSDMTIGKLSPEQVRKVVHSVVSGEGNERIGALAVAWKARIFNILSDVLLPIAAKSDRNSLAPRYAGSLLAQKGEAVDRLPVYWRAVAAANHQRLRESFLCEVETALEIREDGDTVSIRDEHESTWHSEEFPQLLINDLSEARYQRWVEAVQSGEEGIRRWWTGLLIALFRRALIKGLPLVEPLWPLVYPFQRQRFSDGSTRFLRGHVDWVLRDLSYPEVDDQTAKKLLRSLVLDCRSDKEMLEVALGARYEGQSRIESVLESLLDCREPETRARIARLLGWLEGSEARLNELMASDPSLWVRRIAKNALEIRQSEDFSRHWFRVFLQGDNREKRWGAGQLFLEGVDAGTMIWARQYLRNAEVDARTHGEAMLLLRSAKQEVKNRADAWGKSFLGYSVSDLERLWAPWQHRPDWEDLEEQTG